MNARTRFVLGLVGTLLVLPVVAQDIRDDEADVLLAIEREWDAGLKGDHDEVDDMLTDNFMGWSKSSPARSARTFR